MIYQWKEGSKIKLDAQMAGEELERIRTWHNGRLTQEMVVEAARDPGAPLHPHFEWDDQKAADKWRLEQAGDMIRSIAVVISEEDDKRPVRAFVSVVRDDDRSYTSTVHALSDADLRQQVLSQAFRELDAWRHRYAELVELAQVFAVIDQARPAV